MNKRIVILDRDGVINHDADNHIRSPDDWQAIPGSLEAIARLYQADYRIVVATNQSGVGRGFFDIATLNAIHAKMHRAVAQHGGQIDAIFFCPHTNDDSCTCRKPHPGMLLQIGQRFNLDLQGVPMVGDALRDLQAAHTAMCAPHLVLTGKGQKTHQHSDLPQHTQVHQDLYAFADYLLRQD